MRLSLTILATSAFILIFSATALALPTLQVYIPGSTAGGIGDDEDTWIAYVLPGSFDLYVVAAYGKNDISITDGTLLITVPQSQSGTISFSTAVDEPPVLLTISPETFKDTNVNKLTNIAGLDGYATTDFLPKTAPALNHYPLNKPELYDFIIFDLDDFSNAETGLNDYNAETGTITTTSATGEQKEYTVTVSGFDYVHFDAYALVKTDIGNMGKSWKTTWDANPGSHDSAAVVPEPATLLLMGCGLIGVGLLARKNLKNDLLTQLLYLIW